MRQFLRRYVTFAALLATMIAADSAQAQVEITSFDNFTSDALYNSWSTGVVTSGPTSYSITATGYGSNYKYIGNPAIVGAGNTEIELTITLSGPSEADGQLGPLVQLIDGDGSHYHYQWYGQTLGSHVLTRSVQTPDNIIAAGGVPGLDLNTLTHMHMELDPGGFGTSGAYTVEWENLALTGVIPEPGSLTLLVSSLGLLLGTRRVR